MTECFKRRHCQQVDFNLHAFMPQLDRVSLPLWTLGVLRDDK
jgi:hypothetical protein